MEIQTWQYTGWWCCPACPRTSRTWCRCWRCPRESNSSPQILTLKWKRLLITDNFKALNKANTLSIFDAEINQFSKGRLYIYYHRGKMRRPNTTGANTECRVSILGRMRLVTLMHSCKKKWMIRDKSHAYNIVKFLQKWERVSLESQFCFTELYLEQPINSSKTLLPSHCKLYLICRIILTFCILSWII